MENASKALIMAGSVLIAIMVISLGVLVFNKFGSAAKDAANMDKETIAAFNSKITPYTGNNISGSDVNVLLQYCLASNMSAKKTGEADLKGITVKVDGREVINKDSTTYTRVATGGKYYTVNATPGDNGLMTQIVITRNQ